MDKLRKNQLLSKKERSEYKKDVYTSPVNNDTSTEEPQNIQDRAFQPVGGRLLLGRQDNIVFAGDTSNNKLRTSTNGFK